MFSRRVFLKTLSFLALVVAYPLRRVWGQAAEAGAVTLPLDRLQSPWDSVPFTFGAEALPGLGLRLPGGMLVVLSRVCPHQKCFTDFIKDPAQVLRETTYEPSGPVLVCPCHASIFDLLDGGKVIFGPAPRPPDRFKFEIKGDKVVVTGLEKSR